MEQTIKQEHIMELLDKLYDVSIKGIDKISPPIKELANDYLSKNKDLEKAAKTFVGFQIAKCTTSGFVNGLSPLITLPIAIPANIGSVLYIQMRMISCLAYMGGYDINSDQVQTLVYACLAGISVNEIVKNVAIQFGNKFTVAMVKKIPAKAIAKINKKVGFRFLTKFGEKGLINIGKAVPVVGAAISGCFDFAETKFIADRAYKMFIEGEFCASEETAECNEVNINDINEQVAN